MITDQGVMKVTSGQEFPWKSKPLEVLNEGTVENFQDNDSFLIFVDEKQKETLKTVVQPVAEAVFKDFEQKKTRSKCVFFISSKKTTTWQFKSQKFSILISTPPAQLFSRIYRTTRNTFSKIQLTAFQSPNLAI